MAQSRPLNTVAVVTALLVVAAACSPASETGGNGASDQTATTATTSTSVVPTVTDPVGVTSPDGPAGLAVVLRGGADLHGEREGTVSYRAQQDLVLPVLADEGSWLRVLTTCSTEEWVRRSDVVTVAPSTAGTPGVDFDLSRAVIVLDPGHGGRDQGAKGPSGSSEKDANLAIAALLRERLVSGQDVDWDSGHVRLGDQYPAVGQVWMTRDPDGADDGDVELGLLYRAEVANHVGADALLSIHNNTSPSRTLETPGSDVFYAVSSPGSDRLASLIHEELIRGLSSFASSWGGGKINGPKARVDPDTGDDFYGLLRRANPAAVIVEGLYISTETEERLLETQLGQQAYADAVYRGLVRYLTSDESGTPVIDPIPFAGAVGSPSTSSCVVPTQS